MSSGDHEIELFPPRGTRSAIIQLGCRFLGDCTPIKGGDRPSAIWIPPNTPKRAPRAISDGFLIVGVRMIKIDVRRLLR